MSISINLSGQVFGRWKVLERVTSGPAGHARWLCRCECGTEKIVLSNSLRRGLSRSCGCYQKEVGSLKNRSENHPRWKGGRSKSRAGYILLASAEYPGAVYPNMTLEHVVIMARHLGRSLEKGETGHHKNGVRDDNRIENLELWVNSHPRGCRVEDAVEWAKNILERYESDCLTR